MPPCLIMRALNGHMINALAGVSVKEGINPRRIMLPISASLLELYHLRNTLKRCFKDRFQ